MNNKNKYFKNLEYEKYIGNVLDEFGHINGQMTYPLNKMSFGVVNAGFASCELIAIYNVLKDKNYNILFSDLISLAEKNNYLFAYGIFGTKIHKIEKILEYYSIRFSTISVKAFLEDCKENRIKNNDTFIAVIKNNRKLPVCGIHTFEMTYTDHWIVYNRFNNFNRTSHFESINDVLSNGKIRASFIRIIKIV